MFTTREAVALGLGVLAAAMLLVPATADAQFGRIQKNVKRVQQIQDIHISSEEERQLGQSVSARIRARYGVVQDPDVHRYVSLVGLLVAQTSARPDLDYEFIVLDTDAVNAFAAPGGFVHITRGALGLIENEAELAGVLAHEIAHIASKHTIEAIQKNRLVRMGTDEALSNRGLFLDVLANKSYEMIVENEFDRDDELSADRRGVEMAAKAGYAPGALGAFLTRLTERNRGAAERRGLFASHPEMSERLARIARHIAQEKLEGGAVGDERYAAHIAFEALPQTEIAVIEAGAAGLAGGGTAAGAAGEPADEPEEEETKKKRRGFGLARLTQPAGSEKQSAQVIGSGGARGVDPDRDATGGPVPTLVSVTVTAEDLAAFAQALGAPAGA